MLDVFNHRSLSQGHLNDLHGNSDRLAQIGQSVLDTIVTFILIAERPMLCGDEFKVQLMMTLIIRIELMLTRQDMNTP